ncbi:MAG: DUF5615 family PIN-like protein [Candidatus Heimdallarchaeota archaeon]|nr:DUF5615 family PIN-like protein [Candidatus Heimdallarchaeota archaeon]
MKFKTDENFPISVHSLMNEFGFSDVESVFSQKIKGYYDIDLSAICKSEKRILLTLDQDFMNRILHPKGSYYGIIIIKSISQGKRAVLEVMRKLLLVISAEEVVGNVVVYDGEFLRII